MTTRQIHVTLTADTLHSNLTRIPGIGCFDGESWKRLADGGPYKELTSTVAQAVWEQVYSPEASEPKPTFPNTGREELLAFLKEQAEVELLVDMIMEIVKSPTDDAPKASSPALQIQMDRRKLKLEVRINHRGTHSEFFIKPVKYDGQQLQEFPIMEYKLNMTSADAQYAIQRVLDKFMTINSFKFVSPVPKV